MQDLFGTCEGKDEAYRAAAREVFRTLLQEIRRAPDALARRKARDRAVSAMLRISREYRERKKRAAEPFFSNN